MAPHSDRKQLVTPACAGAGSAARILPRERQGQKRTLCNLTHWPKALVEGFRAVLKGGIVVPPGQPALTVRRALPHGHVAAALGTLRAIGLDRVLGPDGNRCRDLVLAMMVARLLAPDSKLATAKALSPATAAFSLGEVFGAG